MERFIETIATIALHLQPHLKSSMERFIGCGIYFKYNEFVNLKSSMERFIVISPTPITIRSKI